MGAVVEGPKYVGSDWVHCPYHKEQWDIKVTLGCPKCFDEKTDHQIAKEVMGYRPPEPTEYCASGTAWKDIGHGESLIRFNPSGDVRDALEALTEVSKDGFEITYNLGYWHCGQFNGPGFGHGITPSDAICACIKEFLRRETEVSNER